MRIYLDHAATSFPKPDTVYQAMDRYHRQSGAAIGRGATEAASELQRTVQQCRQHLATFFDAPSADHIIFASNGTDALNIAIHGFLKPEDHVIASCWDHNSVLRPLETLRQRGSITTTILDSDGAGRIDMKAFEESLTAKTKLVVLNHASNVTGVIQPVQEMAQIAREQGAITLLDAAQSAGHVDVSMKKLGVDMIACPGHKGLLGPLGTGVLILDPEIAPSILPMKQGGTGTASELLQQPESFPDRLESGNHNAPGIVGLDAALEWILNQDRAELEKKEHELTDQLMDGLSALPRVDVVLNDARDLERTGVISFTIDGVDPQVICSLLDEHFSIESRAGLHCAPLAHRELGTFDAGGTVRLSLGAMTTAEEIDLTLEAVGQLVVAVGI